MRGHWARVLALACAMGCARVPQTTAPPATSTTAPMAQTALSVRPVTARGEVDPGLPASAYPTMRVRADLLDPFSSLHPTADGRGVLIGILDSGIDPSVPGLQLTSDGKRKLLDLRDLSGEGRIPLTRVTPRNDTITYLGLHLAGAARVLALATDAAIWVGVLSELPLGEPIAADIDGNGSVGDSLLLVVVRGRAGWILLADTLRDGTLSDDGGIRDFAVAGESFGWSSGGGVSPLHLAANFGEDAGVPTLDLLFDTSGHGTHVAGIAAGYQIGGFPALNGVAPGAQVIGVKIANNRHGGLSVSGSMLRGLDYLIREARAHRMPLVVNLSLGVANVLGRPARIDAILDSALAANPDVIMTVAAGNDGPGLGTIGFPGSATRVLSVGAADFLVPPVNSKAKVTASAVSSYSGRGGSMAGPDVLVPGVAYSTVPRFATGQEVVAGTSMAAPFAAGMVARLISGRAGTPVVATGVIAALRLGALPLPNANRIDQGAGVASLSGAWRVLTEGRSQPRLAVDVGAVIGRGAVLFARSSTAKVELGRRVAIRRLDSNVPMLLRVKATVPWIRVPEIVSLQRDGASFTVLLDETQLPTAGELSTAIELTTADDTTTILTSIPVTVIQAATAKGDIIIRTLPLYARATQRFYFAIDSAQGFQLALARDLPAANITARLFEPGGRPFRGDLSFPVERDLSYTPVDVDASDVIPGLYELVLSGDSALATSVSVRVVTSPVRLTATLVGSTIRLTAQNRGPTPVAVRFRVGLKGAETTTLVSQSTDQPIRLAYPVPAWAARVTVDSWMPEMQWSRFTDLGITLEDAAGHQWGVFPMNFPFSRASFSFPEVAVGDSLIIWVVPGFPERTGMGVWTLQLRVRYELKPEIEIDPGGSPMRTAPRGGTAVEVFPMRPAIPAPPPPGFDPVVQMVAIGADYDWWRIIRLVSPGGGNQ